MTRARRVPPPAERAPIERPPTARPRGAHDHEHPEPEPPDIATLARMERQLCGLAGLMGATVEPDDPLGGSRVTWPGRGPGFNHLFGPRWTEDAWAAAAGVLAARMRGEGELPAVVATDLSTPPDLALRLRERGWLPLTRETVMWTGRAAVVPHLDPSMRIEAVTPGSIEQYEEVERAIFGLAPREREDRLAALGERTADGRVRAYLVRVRDEPVATARLAVGEGGGAVHGVGVVERHRRSGYGRLVTTVVTRAALALGGGRAWLSVAEGNAAARSLYESLDYRPAFRWELLAGPTEGR